MDTPLSRIGRFEFFAIMAPGFHILISCMTAVGIIWCRGDSAVLLEELDALLQNMDTYWPLAIALVFLSYLLGSMVRAISVNRADHKSRTIFGWRHRDRFSRRLYDDPHGFPYPSILRKRLQYLQTCHFAEGFVLPEDDTLHTMYNFWKLSICKENPALFAYTQEFEARVRLFAGMFWGGSWGAILSLAGIVGGWWAAGAIVLSPLELTLPLLVMSVLFVWVFGARLRFMREDETTHVFLGYLALEHGKSSEGFQRQGATCPYAKMTLETRRARRAPLKESEREANNSDVNS